MAYENFKYEREEGIVTITLSRPERMNALSLGLIREMHQTLNEIEADGSVRVIIITGAPDAKGRPCFCAGADLKDPGMATPTFLLEANALMNKLEDIDRVVIAAIDGVCTAGGIELAMCCDIRVVAETVRIGDLHLKNLGSGIGGAGASTRLPRIVGLSNAKMLIFTGDLVDGYEALRMGLANKVYTSDKLLEGAKEIAQKVAAMRPAGVKITKAHLNLGTQMDLHQALRFAELITPLGDPEGMQEKRARQQAFAAGGKEGLKKTE